MLTISHIKPRVSVIIVSYNVRDLLENCLHSLSTALRDLPHEVFVVDNSSDDGSVEMLQQRFPDVKLITNDENIGFAKANNLALKEAEGDFLLLLNPDTLVQEDTIQVMLRFFEENHDVGIAGCKIITPDGSLEPACRRSFPSPWVAFTKLTGLSSLFPRSRVFARYNLTFLSEDESYEVDAISGSFMMLQQKVYREVGGLDESFFMYGEDLDWCYRIQKAGWKIYYVHATKIIHYGGESTKRSGIDAKTVFYDAMELFSKKNLHLSPFSRIAISLGIKVRLAISRSKRFLVQAWPVFADALFAFLSIIAAEYLRFGTLFTFPGYAYPTVYIVFILTIILCMLVAGAYTRSGYTFVRSGLGVIISFLVLSSLTYFFKAFAFSRMIVLVASGINFVILPGRRILESLFAPYQRTNVITGRPTILVGLNIQALDILEKLRHHDAGLYRIVGIVDVSRKHLGENYSGVKVIGSTENIGKVIMEHDITDVIFAPDVLPYSEILSIIGKTRGKPVHYRLVPRSMDFIVGKASIDQLTSVPLLDVEYNLMRFSNRISKRLLDICVSFIGLITLYPFVYSFRRSYKNTPSSFKSFICGLPDVLIGKKSLVGYPEEHFEPREDMYFGKPGLTGLVQLQNVLDLRKEEVNTLTMQYIRNHSLFLDLEILLRTFILFLLKRSR